MYLCAKLFKNILLEKKVTAWTRSDGRTHTPTHTLTHIHSTASCDSYIELTARGLDKNCNLTFRGAGVYLVKANDKPVHSAADIYAAVSSQPVLTLVLCRGYREITLTVMLEAVE